MKKVAILGDFLAMTRLVIEVPEGMDVDQYICDNFDEVSKLAKKKIMKKLDEAFSSDNFDYHIDTECPAKKDEEVSK